MIPNRIINVIDNAGNRLTYESKTIRGNANYRDILTVITPATLSTVVIANYLLYDARNENITQYLVPSSLKGKDLIDPTHENYQDWAEWNVFEVSIHQNALAKISRHNKGKIGLSFNFVVKTADTRATNFIGYFGNEDVPASATEGDYYICELSTYVSTNAELTFNYGQYAIWVSDAWVKSASFTLIGNTTTKEISVDPSVVGIAPTVDDETSNDIYAELGSIQDRVTTAETDIDEVQQNITDMKDGTDAFSEILLGTAQIRYNATKKIVEQVFDDGTTMEVGLELWAIARNEDTTILKNGEVGAINGVVGQQLSVIHADPSNDLLHFKELGVCTMEENIAINGVGKITHFGEVNNIPVANFEVTGTAYAENQELFVSVNGKLTNVAPAEPIAHIHAGWVLRITGSNANIFVYFVKVPHLEHLSDVSVTDGVENDIIVRGSDGVWHNSQRLVTVEGKVSTLETEVQALEDANMIKSYTYNPSTHVLTFTYFDNSTTSFDLPLESAIVDASYDNVTKDITFTLQSGATLVVPLDDLVSGLASETWVTTYFIPKTALKTAFSATPLDTNVISEKLAIQGLQNYTKPFIMPALQFPNYDTVTKTLDFKSDATFKTMLYYGKEKYDIPAGTVVVDNNATTAVQLIFNTTSKVFSFIPHTQTLGNDEIRVAVYKRLANFYEWDFPCDLTVDGVNVKKEYARFATITFTTNLPNYDIDSKTLTFLSTGLPMKLIYGFENYDLPSSFSLTLPTASSIHNLLFDTKAKILYFQIWSTQIRPIDVYLGTIRTLATTIDCNFTFPVTINNQVVYARKNLDGENQLWYRSTIYNVIDGNQNKKFSNNISFIFLTDTHIMSTNKHRLQHYGNHNKFVKSKSIDFSVYGGDIVEGNDISKETTKRYISEVAEVTAIEKETFVLFGNHDDNSYYTTTPLLSNIINKKELYDRILEPLNNGVVHDSINLTSGYYYKDYPNKKIRVICLDYIDYPVIDNGDGTAKWSGINYWGYGARQVTWLETEASNIPSGYKVIVFSHGPARASLNAFGAEVKNGNLVEGILQALSTGGTFTGATTGTDYDVTVNCDFTTQGARKVLAFVHGHTHADYINKPSGLDFVYISVANSSDSVVDVGTIPTGATRPTTRALGTTTEDLWDVFNINIDSGDISITRFGAGSDRNYEA